MAKIIHGLCKRNYDENGKRTRHPLFNSWRGMIQRCTNSNDQGYHNYGGRGITVCHEWLTFNNFAQWAFSNGWEEGLHIDRKENDEGHSPDNCRWVTRLINNCNQRMRKDNKSGYKGIYFRRGKYEASARINGKQKYIGSSKDAKKAALIRNKFIIDNNLPNQLCVIKD